MYFALFMEHDPFQPTRARLSDVATAFGAWDWAT